MKHSNKDKLNLHQPFAVYGMGTIGRKVVRRLKEKGFDVQYIVDSRANNQVSIDGILCITPEQCQQYSVKQVLLGVFNRDVSPQTLKRHLQTNGVEIVIGYQSIPHYIPDIVEPSFWFDPSMVIFDTSQVFMQTRTLFSDELSIKTYDRLLQFRESGHIDDHIDGIGIDTQYFDDTIPGWLDLDEITLIDCGAFDGDTLMAARRFSVPVTKAYCFEPDPANFLKLQAFNQSQDQITCEIYPYATWLKSTTLSFKSNEGESSRVSDGLANDVQAVALDEHLKDIPFHFIKIDVEGSDLATLQGAIHMISTWRPFIAVAIYHRPNDLWEIPLYLSSHLQNYRYYLRQHGQNGFETVLYLCP